MGAKRPKSLVFYISFFITLESEFKKRNFDSNLEELSKSLSIFKKLLNSGKILE